VTIGSNIALPTGISFVTHGGFINGPGMLTLNLRNTIQNTWIRNNGSVEVNPGAQLTISQDASMYSRTERDSSRIDGGSTLLAAGGSTITIDNADLYIGANSTLKLDRTPGIPFPATIVLSGQGGAARSNILTLTGTTGGQIVSIGGLFSSNLTTAPIVGVFLDHTGGDFRSDATVDIFFRGGMRLRRVPGGAQMQGGGSTGIMAHQGSLEIAQDSYMSGAEELDQKLTNDGSLIPGDSGPGALLIPDGGFTQTATGNLTMNLGPISDQIATGGPISLDGSLTLNAPTDFNPSVGTVIILIENQGTGPITGQFQGLNEGDLVAVNATEYTISYQGGDGNDVVLTAQAKVNFNAPANQTTLAGSSATLPLTASASDGHPLTFSQTGLPAGLTINSTTGVISGRIASSAGSATDYAVTVRATYAGGHASASRSFHWTVHPPVITFANPGNQANYAGSTVSLMLTASVSNGDHLTFSQTGLPAGLTIDSATGRISGTIATSARSATPHVVRITVWDADAGISMTITFDWLVS
jgi:hypothetical protein